MTFAISTKSELGGKSKVMEIRQVDAGLFFVMQQQSSAEEV